MVTTSVYVNTTGYASDDDLIENVDSDGGLDRVQRLLVTIEEVLYQMEDEPSFTIKIVDE